MHKELPIEVCADFLLGLAALRRGAPLHDESVTEAVYLERAAEYIRRAGEKNSTASNDLLLAIDEIQGLSRSLERAESERDALRSEVSELRAHIGEHPTLERIISAHSHIPGDWPIPKPYPGAPHQDMPPSAYKQDTKEACYICTLLHLVDALRAEVERLQKRCVCQNLQDVMRRNHAQ